MKKLVLTHLIPPEDGEKMRELAVKKGEIVVKIGCVSYREPAPCYEDPQVHLGA